MKVGFVVLLLLTAATGSAVAQSAGIQRIAWLQGCWELASSGRTVEEQWMAPRASSMVGVSRTVRADQLVGFELVVVREEGGRLAYQAHPSGQPSATFVSHRVTDSSVVFENPDHDFPQQVGYQRKAPDSLLGWIEGHQDGKRRRLEFPYRRAVCPGR